MWEKDFFLEYFFPPFPLLLLKSKGTFGHQVHFFTTSPTVISSNLALLG